MTHTPKIYAKTDVMAAAKEQNETIAKKQGDEQ